MKKIKVFEISGYKGAGKDFISLLIRDNLESLGQKVRIIHFADSLKRILSKTFNISLETQEDLKNSGFVTISNIDDSKTLPYRQILQRFGTEAMQSEFGQGFWKEFVLREIYKDRSAIYIIPDFRFKHEDLSVESDLSVCTIRVLNQQSLDTHISERDLDDYVFNYYVENNRSRAFEELDRDIKEIIKKEI